MTEGLPTSALVEVLIGHLLERYIFPMRSAQAERLLRRQLGAGAYPQLLGPELCDRVNADLLQATDDKHLRLIWHDSAESSQDDAGLIDGLRERFRRENQGVRLVERMRGNVGLIELTLIPELPASGPSLTASMELVKDTEALIFDLRGTLGGSPDAVAFLASFLVPDGETQLSCIVEGPAGPARQFWTIGYLNAPRYLGRPVYVLIGSSTFSGGEALAYDLQAMGRVTVIGEPSRGGAHPSEVVSLVEHIELRLPTARSVNPITASNWEQTGVQPDVRVPERDALEVARRLALETISTDTSATRAAREEAAQALADAVPDGEPG